MARGAETLARLAMDKAEGTYRSRGPERREARWSAKAATQNRGQTYVCSQCTQAVPFILHGTCDWCRQLDMTPYWGVP